MYGFPEDLDLSQMVGHETTQFCVGPYDLQFTFGTVEFAVQSTVELNRNGALIGVWKSGVWPSTDFYQVFGSPVAWVQVVDRKRLVIALANGLELHLLDTSDQFESLQIYAGGLEGIHIV